MKKWCNGIASILSIVLVCSSICCNSLIVKADGEVEVNEVNETEVNAENEAEQFPQEYVFGDVWVGGKVANTSATFLDLNNAKIPDLNVFIQELSQFPLLERVELCDSSLDNQSMEILIETYPKVKFVWNIMLGNFWKIRTDQLAFSCNKGPGPTLYRKDLEVLKYCTDMVALDIGHNAPYDISFVRYMPNLRVFICSSSPGVTDISAIKYCKNLVYFEAWTTSIEDVSALRYLINLKDINLIHTKNLNDISPILHLPRVERFYINDTGVSKATLKSIKSYYPNADVNITTPNADGGNWRTHSRYHAMRSSYKSKFSVDPMFYDDIDRLAYFSNVFDYNYYVQKYPGITDIIGSADPLDVLYFFINDGVYMGHKACETFNVIEYKEAHPELYPLCGDNLEAYMRYYIWGEV